MYVYNTMYVLFIHTYHTHTHTHTYTYIYIYKLYIVYYIIYVQIDE